MGYVFQQNLKNRKTGLHASARITLKQMIEPTTTSTHKLQETKYDEYFCILPGTHYNNTLLLCFH